MATLHGELNWPWSVIRLGSDWNFHWQDDTPWGVWPFRTIWTATSLEDITPFSSSRWILVCGGQPFIHCTVEIRHSKLSLPARILLKVKLFSMLHAGTNGRDTQASQLLDIGQVFASLGVPSDVSHLPSTAHTKSVLFVTLIHLPLVTPRVKLGFLEFLFFFSALINSFLPLSQPESLSKSLSFHHAPAILNHPGRIAKQRQTAKFLNGQRHG
ncbi:hypothetical protein AVEN_105822-1 [Araneus ventricosus]|uniref:Uncharacterized protein n=1 Tax=Araneus ventricosus TaxID=182803 RepID=A0A4Y2X295_ARAVE|nr:hypothetical protein AVEN_5345-1 [Araneus ventricosus]GBO44403.1 hypothetical protein AVEN_105822-1 [Araneus ventricosus]